MTNNPLQGTSAAAAHVAGAAALLLDLDPTLTATELKTELTTTHADGTSGTSRCVNGALKFSNLNLFLNPQVPLSCNQAASFYKGVFRGTQNDDVIIGNASANVIFGLGGNDSIQGLGGDDCIFGGDGNDIISGGDGDDIIDGGAGDDQITGRAGDDTLTGGTGADTLDGGAHGGVGDTCDAGVDAGDVEVRCEL